MKNQFDDTSKTLTEQWKKGELPEGFYYIKVKEVMANYPLLADCVEGLSYTYFLDYEDYVTEVLAPVPSYDEWKALKASYEMSNDANLKQATWMADMEKHNAKLEELLKRCQTLLYDNGFLFDPQDREKAKDVIADICEVLDD